MKTENENKEGRKEGKQEPRHQKETRIPQICANLGTEKNLDDKEGRKEGGAEGNLESRIQNPEGGKKKRKTIERATSPRPSPPQAAEREPSGAWNQYGEGRREEKLTAKHAN